MQKRVTKWLKREEYYCFILPDFTRQGHVFCMTKNLSQIFYFIKIQTSSSGREQRTGTHGGGQKLVSLATNSQILDLTQVPRVDALTAYHQFSLDDLMPFTCTQQPQKLYYCRLHTVIGICFWFGHGRIIVAFQGKMCKGSLTLHQRGLPRGPQNITVFMTATTQGKSSLL